MRRVPHLSSTAPAPSTRAATRAPSLPWLANQDNKKANSTAAMVAPKLNMLVAAGRGVCVTLLAPWLKGGTNYTLTCRTLALVEMQRKAPLPPVLHIQSDGGDGNWAPAVVGWAGALVAAGLFTKVRIARHLSGHGHDIADSWIAEPAKYRFGPRQGQGQSSLSVQHWLSQLKSEIYRDHLICEPRLLGSVLDFERLFERSYHINFGGGFGFLRHDNPNKVMEPLQIEVTQDATGTVLFQYRSYYDIEHDLPFQPERP